MAIVALSATLLSGCCLFPPRRTPLVPPAAHPAGQDTATEIRRHAEESKEAAKEVTFPATR